MTDSNSASILELTNLRKRFREADGGDIDVIHIRRFVLGVGEQVALSGPSGCGKSTLLNLIAGILLPDGGNIVVNGTELTSLSEAARDRFRAKQIGYIFQSFNLLQGFTALENVLLGQMFVRGRESEEGAINLLKSVGLAQRLKHKPRELSVGQQQRVAIARALVNAPPLVLADEPTGSLDAKTGEMVLDVLRTICSESGHALLVVTHDPHVMSRFSRVVNLEDLR